MIMGQSFVQALDVTEQLSITVAATVPSKLPPEVLETAIIFRGLASPRADVTIRQNGSILATVPADPNARFDVEIDIDAGMYTFSVFAEDYLGRLSRVSNFTLSLTEGTTTTVSGIFLGPTIATDRETVVYGDTITVLGATAPDSDITVFVYSVEAVTYQVKSNSDGLWSKSLIAVDPIEIGSHTTRSKAVSADGSISEFSKSITFAVTETEEEPDICATADPGDINCDGFVDLVDFSILLYYWQETNPANARADIDSDGIVNITDFSIMLYYWTG